MILITKSMGQYREESAGLAVHGISLLYKLCCLIVQFMMKMAAEEKGAGKLVLHHFVADAPVCTWV